VLAPSLVRRCLVWANGSETRHLIRNLQGQLTDDGHQLSFIYSFDNHNYYIAYAHFLNLYYNSIINIFIINKYIFLSFSMIFLATLWLFSNSEEDTDNFHIIYYYYYYYYFSSLYILYILYNNYNNINNINNIIPFNHTS
jgi:hypothetical protein